MGIDRDAGIGKRAGAAESVERRAMQPASAQQASASTQEAAAAAQQVAGSAEVLSTSAERLNELVKRFIVTDARREVTRPAPVEQDELESNSL